MNVLAPMFTIFNRFKIVQPVDELVNVYSYSSTLPSTSPPSKYIKLNVDVGGRYSLTNLGLLLIGPRGIIKSAKTQVLTIALPPLLVEIRAILKGLKLTRYIHFFQLQVEYNLSIS